MNYILLNEAKKDGWVIPEEGYGNSYIDSFGGYAEVILLSKYSDIPFKSVFTIIVDSENAEWYFRELEVDDPEIKLLAYKIISSKIKEIKFLTDS